MLQEVEGSLIELPSTPEEDPVSADTQTSELHLPSSFIHPLPVTPLPTKETRLGNIFTNIPKYGISITVCSIILLSLLFGLYAIWQKPASAANSTPTPQTGLSQQSFSSTLSTPTQTVSTIQVYITGAVNNPGVYSLASNARVYELIQMAGGTTKNADLVALNLSASLHDGQEIYVTEIGEVPPAYYGGIPISASTMPTGNNDNQQNLTNINTASETTLEQTLHVSAITAGRIIAYRALHGNYTDISQLLDVVSKQIFDKIRALITI